MTTTALSAVLSSVPKTPPAGSPDTSSSAQGGFSAVLSNQSARQAAGNKGTDQSAPAANSQAGGHDNTAQAAAKGKATSHGNENNAASNAQLADQAADQGLTLAQITLNIAAEVAAVQGNAAGAQAALKGAVATGQVPSGSQAGLNLPALAHHRAANDNGMLETTPAHNAKAVQAGLSAQTPSMVAATQSALAAAMTASATRAGLDQTNAASMPGVTGNGRTAQQSGPLTGQAARLAGMKQAVLTAQQRLEASQNGQAPQPAPDFFNALANAQGESSDPVNSLTLQQADWLARNGASQTAGMHVGNGLGMLTSFSTSVGQQPTVALPLNSPQWGAEFGRQFVSIAQGAANASHTVEMRLDPPNLGPLRISISLHDNTAQAAFVSPHAVVRQAVENALPQLQQLLAEAGIALGDTSVSDQNQPGQQTGEGNGNGAAGNSGGPGIGNTGGDATLVAGAAPTRATANPDALVDTFA